MPPEQITRDSLQIARLEEQVATIRRDLEAMTESMDEMQRQLAQVIDQLTQARGGWRMLMLLGGAGAGLGAALSWVANHVRFT